MLDRPEGTPGPGPWGRPPVRPYFGLRLLVLSAVVALGIAGLIWAFPPPNWDDEGPAFANYTLIGIVLILSVAASRHSLASMAGQLALWAVIALGIVGAYTYRFELEGVAYRMMGEMTPSRGTESGDGAMVFARSADRQFWIDASVNGKSVRFVLDTGASDIVLSRADAARVGFKAKDLTFSQVYDTANGRTHGAPVRLRRIQIGSIGFDDVPASVSQGGLGFSLLGMHLLERLSSIEIKQDRLILRP